MASPPSKCEVPVPVSSSYLLVTIGSKRDQSNKKALVFNFIRSGQISTKRLSRHSHAMFWCVLRNNFVRNLSECDLAKKVFIRAILASSSICRPTSSQRRPEIKICGGVAHINCQQAQAKESMQQHFHKWIGGVRRKAFFVN